MTNIVKANILRGEGDVAYSKVHLYMSFKEQISKRLRLVDNKELSVVSVWRNGANSYDIIIYELLECTYDIGGFKALRVDSSGVENWLRGKETKENM